jgi:hypothetical protein
MKEDGRFLISHYALLAGRLTKIQLSASKSKTLILANMSFFDAYFTANEEIPNFLLFFLKII